MESANADPILRGKIKKQIEFYFSDSNYRKDAFLRAAAESNPEGFVPIATLITFNKLKALSTDAILIANSLSDSSTVEVSSDGLSLRRTKALSSVDTSSARTIYVKGYPRDDSSITHETVSEQFSAFGNVLMVRIRRYKDTEGKLQFKGSVFIEYETEEQMQAAIKAAHDADGKVILSFNGIPFESVLTFPQWVQHKAEKSAARKGKHAPKPNTEKSTSNSEKTADDVSQKRPREEDDDEDDDDGIHDDIRETAESKNSKEEKKESTKEKNDLEYENGLLLKITDIPSDVTLFQIKDVMKTLGDLRFVDYQAGDNFAIIRFANAEAASAAMEAIAKGVSIVPGGSNISGSKLEGEVELAYWKELAAKSSKSRGGGRGGRGRGRGRGRGQKRPRY